jgi:ubiquinone/menaquinone biosynthesis C-methylase UbiE
LEGPSDRKPFRDVAANAYPLKIQFGGRMHLNFIEKLIMINPLRGWVHRRFEGRRMLRLGGTADDRTCLEIGCGRGIGAQIILELFGAARVDAFDLDPHMVHLARRLNRKQAEKIRLWVGDTTAVAARDGFYDAVFDFGALHHVLDWRTAIREVHRVLKPGGRFYVEEVPAKLITHPLFNKILKHPQEDRFSRQQLAAALKAEGFKVMAMDRFMEVFIWVVAEK